MLRSLLRTLARGAAPLVRSRQGDDGRRADAMRTGTSLYRIMHMSTWGDRRFRGLSKPGPNAQDVYLRLLLGPETMPVPGLICAGAQALAEWA